MKVMHVEMLPFASMLHLTNFRLSQFCWVREGVYQFTRNEGLAISGDELGEDEMSIAWVGRSSSVEWRVLALVEGDPRQTGPQMPNPTGI